MTKDLVLTQIQAGQVAPERVDDLLAETYTAMLSLSRGGAASAGAAAADDLERG